MLPKTETEEQDYITHDNAADTLDQDANNEDQVCKSVLDEALSFRSKPSVCG